MKEKPKPSWLREVIEGGKSKDAATDNTEAKHPQHEVDQKSKRTPAARSAELLKSSNLVSLYLNLSRMPPANFDASIRQDRVREHAKLVRVWTPEALHKYLSREDVWARPSLTRAIFDEIRTRMIHGNGDMSALE